MPSRKSTQINSLSQGPPSRPRQPPIAAPPAGRTLSAAKSERADLMSHHTNQTLRRVRRHGNRTAGPSWLSIQTLVGSPLLQKNGIFAPPPRRGRCERSPSIAMGNIPKRRVEKNDLTASSAVVTMACIGASLRKCIGTPFAATVRIGCRYARPAEAKPRPGVLAMTAVFGWPALKQPGGVLRRELTGRHGRTGKYRLFSGG